jgi:hypothetical protein
LIRPGGLVVFRVGSSIKEHQAFTRTLFIGIYLILSSPDLDKPEPKKCSTAPPVGHWRQPKKTNAIQPRQLMGRDRRGNAEFLFIAFIKMLLI